MRIYLFILRRQSQVKCLYASKGFTLFAREERGLKMGDSYLEEEQMALRLFKQWSLYGTPPDLSLKACGG